MSTKNRTIPLNTKEQIEVQTDVNLIDRELHQQKYRESQGSNHVRISEIITTNNILKSFTNKEIYQELSQLINEMKLSSNQQQHIGKRITLIQKQLQGLMKRQTLLYESQNKQDKSKGYYEALCEKDNQLLKMEYKNAYNEKKLRKYQIRISQIQKQIKILQKTVDVSNTAITENQIYKEFIKSLKEDRNSDKKKIAELDNQLKRKIVGSNKNIKVTGKNDQGVTAISKYFTGQIEKLQKQNDLSAQKLNETIIALYEANNNILGNNEQLFTNYSYRSSYQQLKDKYTQLTGVFKSEIEQLQKNNPSIKGLKNVENLISLTEQDQRQVQMINITGWVGIGKIQKIFLSSSNTEIFQTNTSKKILSAFVQSFKTLSEKYPKILLQVPAELRVLLSNSQFLQQTIDIESINNLKQIVTYQPQIIKVQNVYQYNNEKDKSLIFNLRVLIKSLIEEFDKIKQKYKIDVNLDEGILEMLKGQVIQGLDVNSVLKLYRPLPKIVQVQRIVQRPVYVNGTLQKGVPICTQRTILAQTITQKAIQVIKEVPIYIQRVIDNPIKQFIEVIMQTQKIIQIPTIRQVVAQKVITNQQLKQIQVQKVVTVYQEKIVEVENVKQIIIQMPKIVQIEKPIQVPVQKQYIEVQKIIQKPIYIRQVKQKIKEVQLINQKVFQRDRYIQIQQKVPHIITNRQTVYLDRQVPKFITNIQQVEVNITQVIQKLVPYKVIEQKIVEVPVIRQKQLIRQIAKQIQVEQTHFIKGDRQQIIKQVQVIVEKPIRYQVLITKDKQIQKIVPLYHKSEKPIYVELQIPYVQNQAKIINNQTCKIVTVREQVIKQVRIQVPVPVIVEKQVIKIQTVYVDRIIQKIVEVPRIIQIERIVQKIVPIPRIIQKIVQVPRIIQKIVTIQVPCLQIVQIIRQIPIIRQVQVIKQIIIERPQIQIIKQIQIAEKQKVVQIVIEKQIPKQVQVERRIPVQIIREIPVQVSRDRIVQRIVQIHQVTVKDRQVKVPFRYEVPVELIVQKAVATEKVIQNIIKVSQLTQREVPIKTTISVPQIVQINIEKEVQKQVIRQIPGPETIIYIQVPKQIQLLRQKIVQVEHTIQVPKQVYLYMDKIVHEYHKQLQMVEVPKMIQTPIIIQVTKPQFLMSYKQVPVIVETNRNVPIRTFVDQIKQVQKQIHHQQQVEIFKQKIKQIVRQTKQYIQKEVEIELLREVVINQTKLEQIQIPSETKFVQTINTIIKVKQNPKFIQRVVQRIVMLPQILEVTRHFHQITEVQSLGVASGINIEQHTKQYISVSQDLRTSLTDLLEKFKINVTRQPDLKNIINIIENHLKQVNNWINFPKILQVPKEVQKIVQIEKVVLVPTNDHSRQASLSYLVEKLITELKRIKQRNRVELQLDEEIMKLFFKDVRTGLDQRKIQQLEKQLKKKYQSMGQWTKSYPFMINSFLQEFFSLNSIIQESNNTNKLLKDRNDALHRKVQNTEAFIIDLNSQNAELSRNYSLIYDAFKQNNGGMTSEDFNKIVQNSLPFKIENQKSIMRQGSIMQGKSQVMNYKITTESTGQIPTLISKLTVLESKNSDILTQNQLLEAQNEKLKSQLKSTSYSNVNSSEISGTNAKIIQEIRNKLTQQSEIKIKRNQQNQSQQIQRLKDSQNQQIQRLKINQQREIQRLTNQRSSKINNESLSENRNATQQIRTIKRQLQTKERSLQALKKQHQKQIQNIKTSYDQNLEKKDLSIQNVKSRIAQQYEKKIFILKQTYQKDIQKLKSSGIKRQQRRSSKSQINQDNQALYQRIKGLQIELQTSKKENQINFIHKSKFGNSLVTGSVMNSVMKQNQQNNMALYEKIKRLEIELQTSKKENQINIVQKSKFGNTVVTGSVFTSGIKQSQIVERYSPESRSPKIETYQSAIERKYISPNSRQVLQQEDQLSHRSSQSKQSVEASKYKAQMSLRQLMNIKNDEDKQICSTFIMIKIIEKIEEQATHGFLHSFNPDHIYLSNLNPKNLSALKIKLGAPINIKDYKNDALYLAPQILADQQMTSKAVVFNLGIIWDELIHGDLYFDTIKKIKSAKHDYKIRNSNVNPISKNSLFEMMYKDPVKRLELYETKKRLSLQKYIALESRKQ